MPFCSYDGRLLGDLKGTLEAGIGAELVATQNGLEARDGIDVARQQRGDRR